MVGRHQSQKHLERRAFPTTIRPKKPIDLAGLDGEAQIPNRRDAPAAKRNGKNLRDILNLDGGYAHETM